MLERVISGEATPMDLDIIASVQENIIGHCLCVLGDSMAMPVGEHGRTSSATSSRRRSRPGGAAAPRPLDESATDARPVPLGAGA